MQLVTEVPSTLVIDLRDDFMRDCPDGFNLEVCKAIVAADGQLVAAQQTQARAEMAATMFELGAMLLAFAAGMAFTRLLPRRASRNG